MTSYIVDTNAWIAYFEEFEAFKAPIEKNPLKTPAFVLAEFVKIMRQKGIAERKIDEAIEIILNRSVILPLDAEHALSAAKLAAREKLHLADAIIYSYASADEPVLTGDADFDGKPLARVIKKS